MCGIVGYIGKKNATPFLIEGLRSLEYRGYDSAGIFVVGRGVLKRAGRIDILADAIPDDFSGNAGIAHTRWATHGAPTKRNAHPHSDMSGDVWIVHNGIIENYEELREEMRKRGVVFESDTDSEVLVKCIGEEYVQGVSIENAVVRALEKVRGTYGLAVMSEREPEKIVVSRFGSPLLIGIAPDGYYVASDATPILAHTREVIYLDDGEVAVISSNTHIIYKGSQILTKKSELLEWDAQATRKQGYEHFMLKEIMEIPEVIKNTLRGRINLSEGTSVLGGLRDVASRILNLKRIIITGCGSAYYAGLLGKELIEEFSGIPVEVEIASELRYRRFTYDSKHTLLLAISQSGETADTLEAIRIAKKHKMLTIGIVNAVGSSIARETDAGVYNHAGPEISVASTKAFISQIVVLVLITIMLGRQRTLPFDKGVHLLEALAELPKKAKEVLARTRSIERVAKRYSSVQNVFYVGRKFQCPIAYEGALKLKEVAYIHAEGYGAGEMKHGPIALIDKDFLTIALAPKDSLYVKICSNIEEIRARGGNILVITTDGNKAIKQIANSALLVPVTNEALLPILTIIPLQLLTYYISKERGLSIDKPRNLAKSVTVE